MTDRLITDMPDWMVALWKSKKFRWGGDYRNRKDAMHYEFMGTPDDARQLTAEVGGGTASTVTSTVTQGPSGGRPTLERGASGPDVRALQERLNAHGAQLGVDGDFGAHTEEAVKAFQSSHALTADGVVGPRTWAALEAAPARGAGGRVTAEPEARRERTRCTSPPGEAQRPRRPTHCRR